MTKAAPPYGKGRPGTPGDSPEIRGLLADAVRHHRAGRLDQAQELYRKILRIDPRRGDALHLLGILASQTGRNDIAANLIAQAIAQNGGVPAFHGDLGDVLMQQGKLDEAEASFRRALTLRPGYAEVHNRLGNVLRQQGKLDEAITCYGRALSHQPDYAEAHSDLGIALAEKGRVEEAVASFRRALSHRPDYAEAHSNLGIALARLGKLDEAILSYGMAVTHQPDFALAHNNLGVALTAQDRLDEAVASFGRALACQPGYAEAYNNLGIALAKQGKPDEAVAAYRRAVTIRPQFAEAYNNLGNVLTAQDRLDEAAACFEQLLALRPSSVEALNNLANARKYQGRLDEAMASCERAIANAAPETAYFVLAELKRFTAGDPHLAAMEKLAQTMDTLPEDNRIALHFALAKALDDCDEPERAFQHLLQGNTLKRQQLDYDEAAMLEVMEHTRQIFHAERMAALRGNGSPAREPIFIVGMPRSGSTLIEQILASHPRVFGAGERNDFTELANKFCAPRGYPEGVIDAPPRELAQLGARYVARLRAVAPDAARITDKLPMNFLYAGLINLALPNARIIHTRRDPVDTCLSCYRKLFGTGQLFTFDLGELGRYYRGYRRLMAHWRDVLPGSVLIEVDHEELVEDLEGQVRRILAHCGLDWDPACLNFHQTERVVRTASAVQVREQINRRSIGRWHRYASFLQPLLQELE